MKAATSPMGGLMSRIHRQLSSWVRTPPRRVPAAPPAPFMALQRPMALCRAGPVGNEAVMMASDVAAIRAPERPWKARAAINIWLLTDMPPMREVAAKRARETTKVRRWPKWSAARPPSMRKPAKTMA
jgi:hypothetical protein